MTTARQDVAAAIRLLKKQNLEKASPALDFALGNLYFQSDQLDLAERAYEAALKKMPKFRSALANLGRVYLLQDKADKAITVYQNVVRDGQADASMLVLLGHALLMRGHALSGENAYRQALLLEPGNRDALLGLAKALLQQDRYREAVRLVRELLDKDPANAELWSLRANAFLALERTDEALIALESARRLKHTTPAMLATLGDLYLNRSQPREAVARYREAFAVKSPSPTRLLRAAEGLILIGQEKSAAEFLDRLTAMGEAKPSGLSPAQRRRLLRLKADIARLKGDTRTAMQTCRELLRQDPLDGETHLILGDLLRETDKLEEAVMTYERAGRIAGFEARALVRQAQVEVERERYKKAVELLETAQAFEEKANVARYLEQVRRLAQ
jgi:Flp pilus assembly protein TadD